MHHVYKKRRFLSFRNLFLFKVIRRDLDMNRRNRSRIAHLLFSFYAVRKLFPFHWSQTGHCSFQNGLCGLKPDKNATFHWTVGSGKTLTENTGPSYDHTSLNEDGKKIRKVTIQPSPFLR